jgi:hypothetical protein
VLQGLKQLVVRLSRRFSDVDPAIVLQKDGFVLVHREARLWGVRWTEIREVVAFAQEVGMHRRACLGFRIHENDQYFVAHEDYRGYGSLLREAIRTLPGFRPPPRASYTTANYTTVWGEPGP